LIALQEYHVRLVVKLCQCFVNLFIFCAENMKKSTRLMLESLSTLQMIHTLSSRFDDTILLMLFGIKTNILFSGGLY